MPQPTKKTDPAAIDFGVSGVCWTTVPLAAASPPPVKPHDASALAQSRMSGRNFLIPLCVMSLAAGADPENIIRGRACGRDDVYRMRP